MSGLRKGGRKWLTYWGLKRLNAVMGLQKAFQNIFYFFLQSSLFFIIIGRSDTSARSTRAPFISVLKTLWIEKGSLLLKISERPRPASVVANDPGMIPTKVVHRKVFSLTLKNAAARFTAQKGARGIKRKKRR